MRPLITTYVRHAVHRCCKDDATDLERLSCENEWLIDDVCLQSGRWICKEYDLCPVQYIEVVIDWFSVVMWGAIKMTNSPIGGASEFHVRQNMFIRGCLLQGHFSINRC